MSRRVLGSILAIVGVLATVINISFYKEMNWYDPVRVASYATFTVGIFLIPEYTKSSKKRKNKGTINQKI